MGNAFSSRVGVARPVCGGPEFPVALVLAEDWVRDCWIAEAIALDSVPIFTVTVSLVGLESMGGDQCQKYLFLVDVQTYFVGKFFMVIFIFERHFQI